MKNIFKILLPAVAMIFSLSSCDGDAEIPDRGPVAHPQEETKGIYTGEWTRSYEENLETISATSAGTAEFIPGDANYVTSIAISCAEFDIDLQSNANISLGGEGYMFHNTVNTNGFGAVFQGTIRKSDMSVWLTYKKTVKEGRKSVTYTYVFNGKRQ